MTGHLHSLFLYSDSYSLGVLIQAPRCVFHILHTLSQGYLLLFDITSKPGTGYGGSFVHCRFLWSFAPVARVSYSFGFRFLAEIL